MNRLFHAVLALWLASSVLAEGIVCPETAKQNHPVPITLESSIPDGAKTMGPGWQLSPGLNSYKVSDQLLVVAAKPGTYEIKYQIFWIHLEPITLYDKDGNEITVMQFVGCGDYDDAATLKITGEDPEPEPDPDPDPDPDPGPVPPPGKRFVLVIEESGEASAAEAKTLAGLRRYLETQKHQWRFEDPDLRDASGNTPAWLADYLRRASDAKVQDPFIVIGSFLESGGINVLTIEPLPQTADEAIDLVKEYGG